jgi:AraC family transcriptional regulator
MTGGINMNWIKGLQKAINYIETNILENIDYEDVAKCAYSSNFYFQRTFSLFTGMTIGEYIRNRRLTLAGVELSMSKQKIIDVSLKYGYDTPESFAKAFTRFHGITPSAARESGANLKSFSRLSIKIIMEGGDTMDYKIEKKETFRVVAKVKSFSTNDSINKIEIPNFWTESFSDGSIDTLQKLAKSSHWVTGDGVLGICDSCLNDSEHFNYAIAVESNQSEVPDGYTIIEIPAATWAVFKCIGAMPNAIQAMWKRIYSEFFPQSDYEPTQGIDFEYYTQGDNSKANYVSEIWLPVKKKL